MLEGINVAVGVTGGIAAYKSADLVSKLKKMNAEVNVVLTESGAKFITPLTLQTLSGNRVIQNLFDTPDNWDVAHISLAKKVDLFIVAPATANIISKIANGICDDFLTTTLMATKAKVILVPSMNTNMFENKVFQQNLTKLRNMGYLILEPDSGRLACGDQGKGRMPDVDTIIQYILKVIRRKQDLKGKKMLITAGPTREYIDPVRFITNASSGKMGYSIAEAAIKRGAQVVLVSGPVNISSPEGIQKVIRVETAIEMYEKVMGLYKDFDIIIKTAAVSDYRPVRTHANKIKKTEDYMTVDLVKNPDILLELGRVKGNRKLIGFAAETQDLMSNAKAKIDKKNLDLIVANDISNPDAGFASDTNIVKIIKRNGDVLDIPKMAKRHLADIIIDEIILI
ncbi:MAG: bifunctional phosphopantothenoylcysteine decarboxylase/phosphopantothenate--cysteine ligase CoaBC [Clostridia bacterium]|nr:bifunctional phosphopantothenoylcysteine decarboxylase/phosphopantothenate--cysteine ligase CoaBC [Clostridia bacterium]